MRSRSRFGSLVGLGLSLAFALGAFALAAPLGTSYPPLEADEAVEEALLQVSNIERAQAGSTSLQPDEALALAARHHAAEMVRLRYIAHTSPTPKNATLALRVARAGSPAQFIAENLARLPDPGNPDSLARQTLEGWMDSPGHRANVLHGDFTHVGFGVASSDTGEVYVVQVLAALPLELLEAEVAPHVLEEAFVELAFELRVPAEVLVLYGEAQLAPERFATGRHQLRLPYAGQEPLHIQTGSRPPGSQRGFIGQDGGWFDPAAGSWQPSGRTGEDLTVLGAERVTQEREVYRLELRFAEPLPSEVGLWLGEDFLRDMGPEGDTLTLDLPRSEEALELAIGLPREAGGARYEVVLALSVKTTDGAPRLYPAGVGD